MIDGFDESTNALLTKSLVLNQEMEFTEHTYDIKLFKITRAPIVGSDAQLIAEILAYHLEIFNINQPDILYKYRIPVQ